MNEKDSQFHFIRILKVAFNYDSVPLNPMGSFHWILVYSIVLYSNLNTISVVFYVIKIDKRHR